MSRRSSVIAGVAALFVAVGLVGTARDVHAAWVYRGFPPPRDPAFVHENGTLETISVRSAALGGRAQRVWVFLPPGYQQHVGRRYPVFYLLHGFPSQPTAFLTVGEMGVWEDTLVARGRMSPMLLVIPAGSTSFLSNTEWANGIGPHSGWETFVARDVVSAIDHRYRTVRSGAGRAIGGLSDGGYGALNIALHHPGEFRVLESWSGYEIADNAPSVFGRSSRVRSYNSPLLRVSVVAAELRAAGTYLWFYTGRYDHLLPENQWFEAALTRLGIGHRFFTVSGTHSWLIWRAEAPGSMLAASEHLAHA